MVSIGGMVSDKALLTAAAVCHKGAAPARTAPRDVVPALRRLWTFLEDELAVADLGFSAEGVGLAAELQRFRALCYDFHRAQLSECMGCVIQDV